MDKDRDELELLKMRKMLELQKRRLITEAKKSVKEVDPYSVFLKLLTEDGKKMFEKALSQYPKEAKRIGEVLGRLYLAGRIEGTLDATAIYGIFYELGLPIRVETRIVYKKRGEVKSISEMLKEEE